MSKKSNAGSPLILVADDDVTMRILMRKTLESEGFEMIEAGNGMECLELFKSNTPDLIILDLNMPELDGFGACKAIRKLPEGEHIPILMVTGSEDVEPINRSFEAGATSFLPKPVNWALLPHHIRYLVRSAKAFSKQILAEQYAIRLGKVIDNSSNEIYLFEPDSARITQINTSARENLRYNEEELDELKFTDLSTVFQKDNLNDKLSLLQQNRIKCIEMRTEFIRKDETTYPVELNIYYSAGDSELCFAIAQDISERRRAEDRVHYLAYHDVLTGLPNRQQLSKKIADHVDKTIQEKINVALLFVDLDNFKMVNDELGHDVGDKLLKKAGKFLLECVRDNELYTTLEFTPSDMIDHSVARLGGDEFVIILFNMKDDSHIEIVADRVAKKFREPIHLNGHHVRITESTGIAVSGRDGNTFEELLLNADIAMRHSKRMGKNTYCFCNKEMKKDSVKRLQMENALRNALDDDEFTLYFQPFYDLVEKCVIGAEVLLRWNRPGHGMVYPAEFISLSEEMGLIHEISDWVFSNACKAYSTLMDSGLKPGILSINMSAHELEIDELPESLNKMTKETGVSPDKIYLEITEGTVMQNISDTESVLRMLKKKGFMLSIDDFGTGYSSLAYLKHYPFDTIKIDKMFVDNIDSSDDGKGLIEAIISMVIALDFKVIVEGIETEKELGLVKNAGAKIVQGYHICRPLPMERYIEFLRESREKENISCA